MSYLLLKQKLEIYLLNEDRQIAPRLGQVLLKQIRYSNIKSLIKNNI